MSAFAVFATWQGFLRLVITCAEISLASCFISKTCLRKFDGATPTQPEKLETDVMGIGPSFAQFRMLRFLGAFSTAASIPHGHAEILQLVPRMSWT